MFDVEWVSKKQIDEVKDVNVKFPEEYFSKELAGKDAIFKVTLHEIKMKELPKIDDEFAKDVSEFETLDEYKKDLEKKIKEETMENALKVACEVPINIVRVCYDAIKLHEDLVDKGSRLAISDVGVGVQC